MCRVVHISEPYDVFIGRPSKWGNIYSSKEHSIAQFKVGSKKESIKLFEIYLLENEDLFNSLQELKYKTLGCFCRGTVCHGYIIKKYVDKLELLDTSVF